MSFCRWRLWPILIPILALAGCRKHSAKSASPQGRTGLLRIAVIPKGTTHEFWKSIHAGALKAAAEFDNVKITWKGPAKEDDREQQIQVVESFVQQGYSGMVVAPLDDQALVKPIRAATQAGIPVVIIDSGLNAEAGKDYVSFVATDNYEGGRKAAEELGGLLDGSGKIIMLRYQAGSASTEKRERGFLATMKREFSQVEILSSDQEGGATTESAFQKAESLLNNFPDLDGIFCPNESTTFGMLRALQESGRAGKVKFVGFDSSAKLVEALAKGQIQALVLQDPLNMGYLGVKTLVRHIRGQTVKTTIDTGSTLATGQNMNEPRIRALLNPPFEKYLK